MISKDECIVAGQKWQRNRAVCGEFRDRKDVLVMTLAEQSAVAGVFTQNRFCAAPVTVCKSHLSQANGIRALLVNTGCANAGTGEDGLLRAQQSCEALSKQLNIQANQVLPFSTGVILEPLPVDKVIAGLPAAIANLKEDNWLSAAEAIMTTDIVAKGSFDHTFQTGTILAKKVKDRYEPILASFNKVVPYQTYALLHGSSREKHFSPPHDTNHYDTIHAEMALLVEAHKKNISLKGMTLFVNLMPCPNCARTLAETDIAEVVYRIDHSEGYAADLLQKANKTVRRIVY